MRVRKDAKKECKWNNRDSLPYARTLNTPKKVSANLTLSVSGAVPQGISLSLG